MAALTLKDLIDAQQKLKQSDAAASRKETMTVEEFRRLAEGQDKQQDTLKKGLTEKTGDGLNSNVIKLTDEIKKSTKARGVSGTSAQPAGATGPVADGNVLAQRSREQADLHMENTADWLKKNLKFEMPKQDAGMKDWMKSFGNMFKEGFKLRNLVNEDKLKTADGLFSNAVRKKFAKEDYVKDKADTTTGIVRTQGLAGGFEKQFERVNDARRAFAENEANQKRVEDLRAKGYDNAVVTKKQNDINAERERLDRLMRSDGKDGVSKVAFDAAYRNQRAADEQPGEPSTPRAPVIPFNRGNDAQTVSGMSAAAAEEASDENLKLMEDQNELIAKIEENTRPLKDLAKDLGKDLKGLADATTAAAAAAGAGGGGGLLGDLLDMGGSKRGGARGGARGGGRFGRLLSRGRALGGALLSRGGNLIRRAAPLASRAATGVANVGRSIASRAAPLVGQAVTAGTNLAGRVASAAPGLISRGAGLLSRGASAVTGLVSRALPALTQGGSGLVRGATGLVSRGASALGSAGRFIPGLGTALAIGTGAVDAYQGYKQADEDLAAGRITADEATDAKSGAIGKGVGGAGGAIAGAAAGAAIGSVVPIVGTAIGGVVGGALGYFGGSAVGEAVGSGASKAYRGIKSFFGFGDDEEATPVAPAPVAPQVSSVPMSAATQQPDFNKQAASYFEEEMKKPGMTARQARANAGRRASENQAVFAARQEATAARAAPVQPGQAAAPQAMTASAVDQRSAENQAAAVNNSGNVTVVNNNTSTTNASTTNSYAPRAPARNTDRTWGRYAASFS